MNVRGKTILFWLYVLVITGLLRAAFFYQNLHAPMALDEDLDYLLSPGSSLRQVVRELGDQGVLAHPDDLLFYIRVMASPRPVQAGEYRLQPGLTPLGLLDKLQRGEMLQRQITLVEGWTLAQALEAIHANPYLENTLPVGDLAALQASLGLERHPEGLFFPDTYRFTRGTSDRELLERARRRMDQVLQQAWPARDAGLPYDDPYEALIMASIVEKETGLASEREQIAGVFVRRLQQGMRLQTDPTVIYGLGQDFDGNLTRSGLQHDSPYNTYRYGGLPPTPIALPGREAILASLHPAGGEALYFVAKGDGSHHFSVTLEEHNEAVRHYRIESRAENYRSAPNGEG